MSAGASGQAFRPHRGATRSRRATRPARVPSTLGMASAGPTPARVTTLAQDGYAAGEFMSVAVNDAGRVVATYSNGEQIEIFQLVTANFNAENQLKRLDGGVYSSTAESGEAILSLDGGMTGGALESSNTDISEEFTKLITTQQAYAAGTRNVSTSDEMLQEALNMLR